MVRLFSSALIKAQRRRDYSYMVCIFNAIPTELVRPMKVPHENRTAQLGGWNDRDLFSAATRLALPTSL